MLKIFAATLLLVASAAVLAAAVPSADKPGTRDNPLLKRYEGSVIVAQERSAFTEFTVPLARLEPRKGEKTQGNNQRFEPTNKKVLVGAHTRTVYLVPQNRSPLEVAQNYDEELAKVGAKLLFQCKDAECGGDPSRSTGGGGGRMSLAMYLYHPEKVSDERHTTGYCAVSERITEQRYLAAELPQSGAHVSVLAYRLVSPDKHDACNPLNNRTIVVVDLVEASTREQRMVTVQASEMQKAIAASGHVALYGIYFDFNKADSKPESDATLEQIAKLLQQSAPTRLLVVGHTDNVGTFPFNMDLSQRRAGEVVAALVKRYGIARERLTPVGVSFASPVGSNKTDDGRARNRRVELVEN